MNQTEQSIASEVLSDISMTTDSIQEMPWVKEFLSELVTLNNQIGLRWCEAVAKIGIDEKEMKASYCKVFLERVQERLEELESDMGTITAKFLDRIEERLQSIEQNCRLLQIEMPCYNNDGKTMYQLYKYLTREKKHYQEIVEERKNVLDKLEREQQELSRLLGRAMKYIQHEPLPKQSDLDGLEMHIKHLNSLKKERLEKFHELKYEIREIYSELQQSPALDFERRIIETEDVMITDVDMVNIENYLKRLKSDSERVREEISDLQTRIESLWNTLEMNLTDRDNFMKKLTGYNYQSLELLKIELVRCEKLKRDNIKWFVDKLRTQLIEKWQQCHLDVEEQKSLFFPFKNDLYNEDLLELHERELEKWQKFYDDNENLFKLLRKHQELWETFDKLQRTSDPASRYKNRGGKLLIEERTRNKCNKKIPHVEEQLRTLAAEFQITYGRPFFTHGQTVDEHLETLHKAFEEAAKLRMSAKKLQRDKTPVVSMATCSSRRNLFLTTATPSNATAMTRPQTPLAASNTNVVRNMRKRRLSATTNKRKIVPKVAACATAPTLKVSKARRSFRGKRLSYKKNNTSKSSSNKENDAHMEAAADYDDFEEDLVKRPDVRSTLFQV